MGLPQEPACSAVDVYSKMAAMTNGYVSPADAKAADDKDVSDVTQRVSTHGHVWQFAFVIINGMQQVYVWLLMPCRGVVLHVDGEN